MEDLPQRIPDQEIDAVLQFIIRQRGIDLSSYRRNFLNRHLRSRLIETRSGNVLEYIECLKKKPGEFEIFLDDLSVSVTSFFRDNDVFESFVKNALPQLFGQAAGPGKKLIRIWSAACASGQETYSIAMMMNEAAAGRDDLLIRVWGTDVDADALDKARKGRYTVEDLQTLPDKRFIGKYFDSAGGAYTVKNELKSLVRFEKHNLISDPPLRFMHAIFCRNVMIYFNHVQQDAMLAAFAKGLSAGGYLVLAKVEGVRDKSLFAPVDAVRRIYRKMQ
jgi:two-component system, chemotaxis family, CheB/CheR fusion protein